MALFSRKSSQSAPRRRHSSPAVQRPSETTLEERYAFRRNRTLTGSASSRVVSSSEGNAQLKSPRVHAHELAAKRRHIGMAFFLALMSSAGLYALISQFTAGVIITPSNSSLNLEYNYEEVVQGYLSSQPLQRLRFLINEEQLTEYMQTKTPEIASIHVEGPAGFGKTQFMVEMRKPIAGWKMNNQHQYVDGTGTPFERNYFSSPSVEIVDKSGVPIETGRAVASNRFLTFVGRVVGLTPIEGYKVTQVIIPLGTTRQVDVMLEGVPFPIKLAVGRPAGEQVEDMARAVRWMTTHKLTPQYVDVRVGGKAYYR